jgi:nicotinamide phosphoribosyltransferase
MKFHPTTATDAYKLVHWMQRPEGLTELMSYGEPRVGGQHKEIIFFGLQYLIKEYFMTIVDDAEIVHGYKRSLNTFGKKNYFAKEIWEKVRDLGYYPLEIRAVKEGTRVPTGNVCYTINATEDWFAPMVSHFEDWLMWCWYPTAVATRMYNIQKGIAIPFKESCDAPFLDYVVNDFGLRGAPGLEAACLGGAAALIFSNGSDNCPAMDAIEDYYNDAKIGGSVWATEHSVATVFGPDQGEYDYLETQLDKAGEDAITSIVIDSYDDVNFIKVVVKHFKDRIIARSGRTVFRPDSGVPLENVCKYTEMLANIFGYHINEKGYKVLNHNVGLIQGDGMNENSIVDIYTEYIKTGWAAENFIVGSGGGLLVEGLSRDTDRWAVKCCYAKIDGLSVDVRKSPKGDMTKASKAGKLKLHAVDDSFITIQSSKEQFGENNGFHDALELVYKNGKIYRDETFSEIRKTAKSFLYPEPNKLVK